MINFIDTNIFIYYFDRLPEAIRFFQKIKDEKEAILFSYMTRIELLSSPKLDDASLQIIEKLVVQFMCIEHNKDVELIAINLRRKNSIKIPDAIIAASAIYTDSILVTRNVKDFQNITDLKLLNPFEEFKNL